MHRFFEEHPAIELFCLAFLLFFAFLVVDLLVAPRIPWGTLTALYWGLSYGCWLGFFPMYAATKRSLRDGTTLLGFNLAFWAFEDSFYYHLRGYPAFSPFPDHPGMYPLIVSWYPAWFLILGKLFLGLIVLAYVHMDPDWGLDRVRIPSLDADQITWILRVCAVACAGSIVFAGYYLHYSRASFGGKIVYEIDPSYKKELSPETVYKGVLVRKEIEVLLPAGTSYGREVRYVLARYENLSDLVIARPSPVLDAYLYREVEILGKLVDRQYRRELLPGRIRETGDEE